MNVREILSKIYEPHEYVAPVELASFVMGKPKSSSNSTEDTFVFKYCLSVFAATVAETGK